MSGDNRITCSAIAGTARRATSAGRRPRQADQPIPSEGHTALAAESADEEPELEDDIVSGRHDGLASALNLSTGYHAALKTPSVQTVT